MSSIASLLSNLLGDYKKSLGVTDSTAAVSDVAGNDNASSDSYGDAYVLDLSEAAQDILDSKNSSSVISLTDTQKEKLKAILDKYKDAPNDSETQAALYEDLQKAGLTPDQLAIIQEAKDFNPVQVLIQILTGSSDSNNSSSTDSALSGLSSTASGTPLGELLDKYKSNNEASSGSTLADAPNQSESNTSSLV